MPGACCSPSHQRPNWTKERQLRIICQHIVVTFMRADGMAGTTDIAQGYGNAIGLCPSRKSCQSSNAPIYVASICVTLMRNNFSTDEHYIKINHYSMGSGRDNTANAHGRLLGYMTTAIVYRLSPSPFHAYVYHSA